MEVALESFFTSFLLVFFGEMGDKTQLLSLVLVTRYGRPWTILAGVFVATLLNHALASWAGVFVASMVSPQALNYLLALTFFAFAVWVLFPDKDEGLRSSCRLGVFLTTLVAFFIAEMGDKTQLATVALGARYSDVMMVTIGSTLGMMGANALAVFLGGKLLKRVSMRVLRVVASALFLSFGLGILLT